MKLRFRTSIAGDGFSYLEGVEIDVPDPAPARFVEWLKLGIVEAVRERRAEAAVAYPSGERAVVPQRSRRTKRGGS